MLSNRTLGPRINGELVKR